MKKYLKYLSYVIRHKWFVFIECYRLGEIWRGIWHDMSKFLPSEFIPYARYFYGEYPSWEFTKYEPYYPYSLTKEGISEAFDLSWLLHQHRNPHHWQHWILREDDGGTKFIDIPSKYIQEMLCDWSGAGRAITGKNDPLECTSWYLNNYDKIQVSKMTRTEINLILKVNK